MIYHRPVNSLLTVCLTPGDNPNPPLPPAHRPARFSTHSLLRLPGQLPPLRQTRSLPSTTGYAYFSIATPVCRLPRLPGPTHPHRPSSLSAMRPRHPPPGFLPRPNSAPSGHLMMPASPNSFAPRRSSCGSLHSICVYLPSNAGVAPIAPPISPFPILVLSTFHPLLLTSQLLHRVHFTPFPSLPSHSDIRLTEQNPLKAAPAVQV